MRYTFDYTVQPDGTAALARVYGEEPVLVLPETLPGPDGQPLPLARLGSYCFSGTVRDRMPGQLFRCGWDGAGPMVPADPAAAGEELHPIAGSFLEEMTLPQVLREIGSCAFYNCRALRKITMGSGPLSVGSDVFLNCFVLTDLVVCARPDAATGLSAIVNNISSNLRVSFLPDGPEGEPAAVFRYPEYWEDIEETPAHILLHTFSGQGYHYRQCFRDGRLLCDEYDAIFAQGHGGDDPTYMALLCLDRLRYPWQLGEEAASCYRAFLAQQGAAVAEALIRAQDRESLRALLDLKVLDGTALAAASGAAQRAGDAQSAALLADAEYRARPPKPKRRYTFDDF